MELSSQSITPKPPSQYLHGMFAVLVINLKGVFRAVENASLQNFENFVFNRIFKIACLAACLALR